MEIDPIDTISNLGGLAATHELDRRSISAGLRSGRMIRVRQGWYADARSHPDLMRAARVGGRVTCSTALDLTGVWVVRDRALHVAVSRNACQLRAPQSHRRRLTPSEAVVVHWRDSADRSRLIVDPLHALEDLCRCLTAELVAASADSLIRRQPAARPALLQMARRMPSAHRSAMLGADGVCESGIETIFWLRMRHLAPRRQVRVPGVGRVDFLFGDRLIVEVDGQDFHTDPVSFESDRHRDAVSSSFGYRVLRFSYRQVMDRWPEVRDAVRAAIARGDRY